MSAAVNHAVAVADTSQDPALRTAAAASLRRLLALTWRYPALFRRTLANLLKIARPRTYALLRRCMRSMSLASH